MKLDGRVHVEPLDDERWTNIERAVVSGAAEAAVRGSVRSSRWALTAAFGAAMLVVVVAAGLGWRARTTVANVDATPLAVDTSARAARIDLGDATIHSDPATAFVVTRPGGGILLTLARGRVELDVDKRGDRAPLVVRAGDTDVVVVGTRFAVDFGDGTRDVAVAVTEGVVQVVRAGVATRVAANQAWSTTGGLVATSRVASVERAGGTPGAGPDAGAVGAKADPSSASGSGAAALAVASGPAGASTSGTSGGSTATTGSDEPRGAGASGQPGTAYEVETGSRPRVLRERQVAVPDAKLSTSGAGSAASRPKPPAGGPELRTRPQGKVEVTAAVDLRTEIKRQAILPALDVGPIDPATAISRYRQIVTTETGARASQAFYSIAVVQYLKLQRTSDALSTLDGYVRRFAGGKEHTAALWLRVRILCLQKIDDRCRQAAYTYVHQTDNAQVRSVAEMIVIQR